MTSTERRSKRVINMGLVEKVGIIWFEIAFFAYLSFIPYFLFATSVWLYILGIVVLYFCLHVVRSRTKKHIVIEKQGVFITGCDTGFGHDLAVRLDHVGFTVFAGCLNETGTGAERLKTYCSDNLHVVPINVCLDDSVKNAVQYVKDNLPEKGLWAVVNNAGIYVTGDVEFCTIKMYDKIINVNLYGMIRVTQTFLPLIRQSAGRIVNVSSIRGMFTLPGNSPYILSKHGVETVSDSLRMEMVKFGVKVVIIEPGSFPRTTGLFNPQQVRRLKGELEEMWECASEDCRETYGKHYLDGMDTLVGSETSEIRSADSTAKVVGAMEDAITNVSPKTRYLIDGGRGITEPDCVLARLYRYTPTWIMDPILVKWRGHVTMPKPPEQT